jgi:carboxymethylenebutenolidase
MNKIFIIITIVVYSSANCFSQTKKQCCKAPSAASAFATFANNSSFISAHESPKALSYAEKGKMVSFPSPDGKNTNAYMIKSDQKSNDYLIVFHEYWGLNDYTKRQSDLYFDTLDVNVIAVDLYDGQITSDPEEAGKLMQSVDEQRAVNIIKGALAYAGRDAKIATVGWCFGGGWSLQGALLAGKQATACVMYYGMPETDINKLKNLNSEVLFVWAKKDQWINEQVKNEFIENMKAADKRLTVKEYDADHAFANPSNPHFDESDASEAQKITLNFLRSHFE